MEMILDVAIVDIKSGMETDFEVAFDKAQYIIRSMKGYISHPLQKSIKKRSQIYFTGTMGNAGRPYPRVQGVKGI